MILLFIDNGTTPSILPLRTYNKYAILHTYVASHITWAHAHMITGVLHH